MAEKLTLSIVVPCFNEQESLPLFYNEIRARLDKDFGGGMEFIFVDDGSSDNTENILKELALKDERVHYVIFSRNFGKESAMLAGLRESSGEFIVMIDADLQHPPSLIPQMLDEVKSQNYDCAAAVRTRSGESKIRTFFSKMFYRVISRLSNMEVIDGAGDFRLMSRQYADAILSLCERCRFSKGIFQWIGFRVKYINYENVIRAEGSSKWSFWKLFLYSLDGIIAFSSKLLAFASAIGILMFIVSSLAVLFIVFRKIIFDDPVQGWASTASIILFCSSIQLFAVGVLGEYLAKTYNEVKQRPHFIIRKKQ